MNLCIRVLTILIVALLAAFSCGCSNQNRLDLLKYKKRVLEDREKKNQFFKFSESSPIPSTERWQFKELNYFPVEPQYQVKADYHASAGAEELVMQTSSGQPRAYVKVGHFEFVLSGEQLKLSAYQEKAWVESGEKRPLFVPFTDKTTGLSTYGAGRYLDVRLPESGQIVLDFNFAYNPYCAYTTSFSCPLPPPENNLPVLVEAGEKLP